MEKMIYSIILGIDMIHEITLYNNIFSVKIHGNDECMIMRCLVEVLKLVAKVIMTREDERW